MYRIITKFNIYPKGKAEVTERPLPKLFSTRGEAEDFANKFYEPPVSVLSWRIEEVK